ncbi:MAG: alpha/beta hydrolase fold domain-containing protein, partial [Planctomycetaceae bacterium]|nr:alpha/beta hydrolase fold domain-containing protein [Planctomycetaceae bacterium]
MSLRTLGLFALLLLGGAPAEPPEVVRLWPAAPPGDAGIAGPEKDLDFKVDGKPYQVGGKPTRWVTNVSTPTLTVYRAPRDRNSGVAMLIAPGGGYHNLGWDVEGEEVAAWLNSIGIHGILLKYRCPRRAGDAKGVPPVGPLMDAQRAVSLVRSRASEWGLDPAKIGIVGFSAGGHLAGATATRFEG